MKLVQITAPNTSPYFANHVPAGGERFYSALVGDSPKKNREKPVVSLLTYGNRSILVLQVPLQLMAGVSVLSNLMVYLSDTN